MQENWRIGGVYDESILEWANQNSFTQLQFDLVPTSLSFVQLYRIQEIMEKLPDMTSCDVYLNFQNEKQGSIEYILNEVKKSSPSYEKNLKLLFTDILEKSFYEKFNIPFSVDVDSLEFAKKVVKTELNKELLISFTTLEFLHGRNQDQDFLKEIFKLKQEFEFDVYIKLPWEFDKISSIFDFYHFDGYLLNVNTYVENSYRQFNAKKASEYLESIKFQLRN